MAGDPFNKEYLGKGISYPLKVNARGEISLAGGVEKIEQSIRIILGTRPGERVMRPTFGCRAQDLLFEPRDASTAALIQRYVREALSMWEPRIEVLGVDVFMDDSFDGAIYVEIRYFIKPTHDERSIVYPFFLVGEEGW